MEAIKIRFKKLVCARCAYFFKYLSLSMLISFMLVKIECISLNFDFVFVKYFVLLTIDQPAFLVDGTFIGVIR